MTQGDVLIKKNDVLAFRKSNFSDRKFCSEIEVKNFFLKLENGIG